MDWHRHNGEAEAHGNARFAHYSVKYPFAVYTHLEAWCNGTRLAKVDTVDEGIRLCEWVERSGNAHS